MRISRHGNDLLITDQSLGRGAFMVAIGVFLLAAGLGRLIDMESFLRFGTFAYLIAGALFTWDGMRRLIATQLIVDPDRQLVIVKRWTMGGAQVQRIPFTAVTGFSIVPEGELRKTSLIVQTTRGDVLASGGTKGARAAWEEIISAVLDHMDRSHPKAAPDDDGPQRTVVD